MITPKQQTFYMLPMMAHEGDVSLDAIATRVYGRTYRGQQTGEMISNDTHVTWYASNYKQCLADIQEYIEDGDDLFANWLALPEKETYGSGRQMDNIETIRSAPIWDFVLADLVQRGELPLGDYLIDVSW